jgi:hypothetical protein
MTVLDAIFSVPQGVVFSEISNIVQSFSNEVYKPEGMDLVSILKGQM